MSQVDAEDAARMRAAEVKLLGITVAKLLALKAHLSGVELRFIERLDTQINVLGQAPDAVSLRGLKDLAWKFRRLMPAHLAPKLPPHDPVVREMEAGHG